MISVLKKESIFYLLVSAFSIFLFTFNLGQTPFWDDEAMVSWYANSLLRLGEVTSFDGFNAFLYRNGSIIEYRNPPLDIYLAAFFQKYIGTSEKILRLCFASFSFVSLYIFYKIISETIKIELWKKWSFLFFALGVNFILYSRNCRYYSLAICFGLIYYYLHLIYVKNKSKNQLWISAFIPLTFIILFFIHYTQAVAWFVFCGLVFLFSKNIKSIFTLNKSLIFGYLIALIPCIVYAISHQIWVRNDNANTDFILFKYLKLLAWYINDQNRYQLVPIWMLAFLIIAHFVKKINFYTPDFRSFLNQYLLFGALSILFSPQDTSHSNSFDIRYTLMGIFLAPIITSYFFVFIYERLNRLKPLIYVFIFIWLNSSLFFYIPESTPFRWTLSEHIYSKSTDYSTPLKELVSYFKLNKLKGESLTCLPDYYNTVMMNYFSPQFRLSNVIDSNLNISDSIIQKHRLSQAYKSNTPDIVIVFGDRPEELKTHNINLRKYNIEHQILINAQFSDYSRPEMPWHEFSTLRVDSTSIEKLVIYRLKQ
jgi:hypothetical protein